MINRTRIQISTEYGALGMFGTVGKVTTDEGVAALWKGVNAAWLREASYTSLRLGLYEPTKVLFGANDPATATFLGKFMAGSAAGAIGSIAGNPFDGTYTPNVICHRNFRFATVGLTTMRVACDE